MSAQDFTAACEAVSGRSLGALGQTLGQAMAADFPPREINTALRVSHFLAQTAEETGGFRWLTELGDAAYFAKYDGRADLGNSQPGDGFAYRGRGLAMLTGRANYAEYGTELRLDLIGNPDLAADPATSVAIACAYWAKHNLNPLADADNITEITWLWNGGLNGLATREAYLATAKTYFAAHPIATESPVTLPPVAAPVEVQPGVTVLPLPAAPVAPWTPPIPLTPSVPQLPPPFTPAPVATTGPTLTTVATPARVGATVALTGLVAGATAMTQTPIVNLKGLIDLAFIYLVAPLVLGIVVGLATSLAKLLNINIQGAVAQRILTAAENGASALVSKAQTEAEQTGTFTTKNDLIAGVLNYTNTAVPDAVKAAGLATPAGQAILANLAEGKIQQAVAAITPQKVTP